MSCFSALVIIVQVPIQICNRHSLTYLPTKSMSLSYEPKLREKGAFRMSRVKINEFLSSLASTQTIALDSPCQERHRSRQDSCLKYRGSERLPTISKAASVLGKRIELSTVDGLVTSPPGVIPAEPVPDYHPGAGIRKLLILLDPPTQC